MNCCFNGAFRVTSPFGERILNGKKEYHNGIDLVGVDDTTVYAPCDAVVLVSQMVTDKNNKTWEWGNYICLASLDGMYHIYLCHLATRNVVAGQKVKKGDKLGTMGSTGYAFGAHTHFEVRKGSSIVNAAQYIGVPNKEGVYKNKSKLEEDLEILEEFKVTDTPEYWLQVVSGKKTINLNYLEKLLGNMAEALR